MRGKTWLLLAMVLLLAVVMGCSGGGSSGGGGGSSNGLSCASNGIPKFSYSISSTNLKNGDTYTESYSWCDSDADIKYLKGTVSSQGLTVPGTFTASDYGITGASGSSSKQYTWSTTASAGTYVMTFWLEDAKGNSSNSVTVTVIISKMEQQGKIPENGLPTDSILKRSMNAR